MHTPPEDPAVSCQRAGIDNEEIVRTSCSGLFDRKIVEVIARHLVDGSSDASSSHSVVSIHHLTVQIRAKNHAGGARKISEADLQLVETVRVFVDQGD